jgi:Ni,Fe-hydrogenase III large subunit
VTSARVTTIGPGALEPLDAPAWRDAVAAALAGGARAVTLYGQRPPSAAEDSAAEDAAGAARREVLVTAILEAPDGAVSALRGAVDPARGYHALTADFLALQAFERELHEQHGVRLAGHPWLKPIRFEQTGRRARDAYPFYEIAGKEVHEVAVGPIHAGVIEPGSFRFMCHGERVHHLELHHGYQHRGVEALLRARDPRALAPLVETIAGDSSVAHAWAYAAAIEELAGAAIDPSVDAARASLLELERIAMHLSALAGMAGDVGFLQGASTYGRLRTTAINASMRLCGSRFGRGAIRPAGLGARLGAKDEGGAKHGDANDPFTAEALQRDLELVRSDAAIVDDCFLSSRTVRHRLRGTGVLAPDDARAIGAVGLVARASGLRRDLRAGGPGAYARHAVEPVLEPDGDCWARARVRVREIHASLAWLRGAVEAHPVWTPARASVGALAPRALVVARVEGCRGEVVHVLETDDRSALAHYKVQDPSLANWLGLALAVRGEEISDFPICNKSFDLSYCGNDL